jgi:F0F1-type ATP synthase assembly protein I
MKNSYFKYSSMGLQMVITIGLFIFLGRKLDSYFDCDKPWFTLFFALLACSGMIAIIIRKIK